MAGRCHCNRLTLRRASESDDAFGDDRLVSDGARGIWNFLYPHPADLSVVCDWLGYRLSDNFLSLDNTDFYQHQVFPVYPNAAVNCPRPVACAVPAAWQQYATSEVSAFAPDFKTPRVQQASLSLEREVGDGFTGTPRIVGMGWI